MAIFEEMEIIDQLSDILGEIETEIKWKFQDGLEVHNRFKTVEYNELEKITPKKMGESKAEYVKRVISEFPLEVMSRVMKDIKEYNITLKEEITPINLIYRRSDRKVMVKTKIPISNMKYITEIKDIKFFLLNQEKPMDGFCRYKFIVESVDYFSSEITIYGEIEFKDSFEPYLDETYLSVELKMMGLEYDNTLPAWLDILLESAIYYKVNNTRMSVFKCFVAFDSFVQTSYNQIRKYYNPLRIEKRIYSEIREFIEDSKITYVDDCCYEKIGELDDSELDDLYQIVYERVIQECKEELEQVDVLVTNEVFRIIDKICQKEKYYSNQSKYLIKQKLKDVENLLGINCNDICFSGLSNLKNRLKKIEIVRNGIAHGNYMNEEIVGDEIYVVFSYILSLINIYDFHKNKWEDLIDFN